MECVFGEREVSFQIFPRDLSGLSRPGSPPATARSFPPEDFREVFDQFWQYAKCMPVRNRHTTNAAWRLVVETWLRRQGWISVTAKNQTQVSTDSKPFFSQN